MYQKQHAAVYKTLGFAETYYKTCFNIVETDEMAT